MFTHYLILLSHHNLVLKSLNSAYFSFIIREFKKLRRQVQRKHDIKVELCVNLSDYSMLVMLYKIDEVHFRLLGKNGYCAKAKNERFSAASSRCRQNLKYENFTSSFHRLRQKIAPKITPHVQHNYFPSFSQSNHGFVALTLPSPILKLPTILFSSYYYCFFFLTKIEF